VPYSTEFEISSVELEYPYLGHRDYTHGSSMLEGMLKAIEVMEPNLVSKGAIIKNYKVINQFSNLSRAEAMRTSDVAKHPSLGEAKARLDLVVDGNQFTSLLFSIDKPITWRLDEYSAGDYVEHVEWLDDNLSFGRMIRITDFIDLIRGVNECNRQLTVNSFPDANWSSRVRWAYIKKLALFSSKQCSEFTRVNFERSATVDMRNHRFEIRKGQLVSPNLTSEFEICFFIELPQANGDRQ